MSRVTHKTFFDESLIEDLMRRGLARESVLLVVPQKRSLPESTTALVGNYYFYEIELGVMKPVSDIDLGNIESCNYYLIVFVDIGKSLDVRQFLARLNFPIVHIVADQIRHKSMINFAYTLVAPGLDSSDAKGMVQAMVDDILDAANFTLSYFPPRVDLKVQAIRQEMTRVLPARPRLRTRPGQKRPRKPKA